MSDSVSTSRLLGEYVGKRIGLKFRGIKDTHEMATVVLMGLDANGIAVICEGAMMFYPWTSVVLLLLEQPDARAGGLVA